MQLSVAVFLVMATTVVLVSSHPAGDLDMTGESLAAGGGENLVRDKRTIGILRQLFPNFSQIIDRKIQMLTRVIFRIVGRLILQGGAGQGGGGGGGGGDGDDSRVQITLPTYPPDELEGEDEDTTGAGSTTAEAGETTTNSIAENSVGGETKKREVRSKREADGKAAEEEEEEEDLEPEATGENEVSSDSEGEADESGDSEDPRNKRFLNFGGGASASAGGAAGGSGGGSGNFIFDIIRADSRNLPKVDAIMVGCFFKNNPDFYAAELRNVKTAKSADRAARMAGTVFRVLAGTDDAGLPSYNQPRSLVAGSGNTPSGDAQNAAIEEAKDDAAYGVGVPGPLTRLFVVANKGVAALIQDLILRLAQTSERIVNFKARLITSII